MYKAIIYDIDNTILDTFDTNFIPLQKVVKKYLNQEISLEQCHPYAGLAGKKIIQEVGFKNVEEDYQKWLDQIRIDQIQPTPFDGIEEVLKQLGKQYIQAIVSSKLKAQYTYEQQIFNYGDYMKVCVLADDTKEHKPSPKPINYCLEQLKLKPSEALYVGDAIGDYLSAKAAGVDFVYARYGNRAKEEFEDVEYIIDTPLELIEIINNKSNI